MENPLNNYEKNLLIKKNNNNSNYLNNSITTTNRVKTENNFKVSYFKNHYRDLIENYLNSEI